MFLQAWQETPCDTWDRIQTGHSEGAAEGALLGSQGKQRGGAFGAAGIMVSRGMKSELRGRACAPVMEQDSIGLLGTRTLCVCCFFDDRK